MGLQESKTFATNQPDLRGRTLVGVIWDPETSEHSHITFEFANDEATIHGTMRGGPILFGTFIATWDDGDLRIDWKCATASGFAEGRTFAAVESVCGGRVRLREKWIDAGDHSRPGFLTAEEPMTDEVPKADES